MAYRDFTMDDIERKFGIREVGKQLFDIKTIATIQPSEKLKADLADANLITLSTEKAVSEQLVAPVLREMKRLNPDFLQIFSGEIIKADSKAGLNGEIDFIFSKTPVTIKPRNTLLTITESKLGLIDGAVAQAVAQMIGLRVFNQKRDYPVEIIYGSITDGRNWRFLKLEDKTAYVDSNVLSLDMLPVILGILQEILNFYQKY